LVMKRFHCDILVVGAGPAGSSAATAAAKKGMSVLVADRSARIGIPVRCAEYIPAQLLGEVNLGSEYVAQRIRGMRTWLPDGSHVETVAPGFTIHRDLFDQTLAREAERAGAEILLSTTVLYRDNQEVVVRKKDRELLKISPRIIIGADGPHSKVGEWISSVNRHLIPSVQARVLLKNPLEFTHVYFHKDIYGGYGWLFPKGNEANVGLGRKKKNGNDVSLKKLLEQFIGRLVEEGKIFPKVLKWFGGWIPAEPVRRVVKGNVLLVGDAAGHTHPITGAGIAPALISGRKAGEWAVKAIEAKDLALLSKYENDWRDSYGEAIDRAYHRRNLLERHWGQLDTIIKTCWVAFREYYVGTEE